MKNFRVMYLRDRNNHPVGCVAIKINGSFHRNASVSVEYQVSVLNPQDNFERKMARLLALGRLVESPFSVKVDNRDGEIGMHTISKAVMNEITHNLNIPTRAKKAAGLWLKKNVAHADLASYGGGF